MRTHLGLSTGDVSSRIHPNTTSDEMCLVDLQDQVEQEWEKKKSSLVVNSWQVPLPSCHVQHGLWDCLVVLVATPAWLRVNESFFSVITGELEGRGVNKSWHGKERTKGCTKE